MGLTVYGGGGKPEEEKTVTAGTSVMEVLPSSGKTMKKVNVNPTPTEEKTITAGTSTTTVTPTSGKYIKKVTVNPTPSQSKTVTPSTSQQTVSPDSGKLLSQVIVKAMEDVTPEVTAQTPVITQIAENLGVTITTPSGTNKQILQGNNANLLNINNNAKKEGAYVWKKLTAQGGDFVDFVVSDSETAYPDGAVHTDGYWYELVVQESHEYGIFFNAVNTSGYGTDIKIKVPKVLAGAFYLDPSTSYASAFDKVTALEIETTTIGTEGFAFLLENISTSPKVKIKATSIGEQAFEYWGNTNTKAVKYWISKNCTKITARSGTYTPFYANGDNTRLYCEAEKKPNGWSNYWNYLNGYDSATTTWGVAEADF